MKKLEVCIFASAAMSLVIGAGCAREDDDGLREKEQNLAAYGNWDRARYWSPGDTVHVCFAGTIGSTERAALWSALDGVSWGSLTLQNEGSCSAETNQDWVVVYVLKNGDPYIGDSGAVGIPERGAKFPIPWISGLLPQSCSPSSEAAYSTCVAAAEPGVNCESVPHTNINGDCVGDRSVDIGGRDDVDIFLHYVNEFSGSYMAHEMGHVLGLAHEHLREDGKPCGDTESVPGLLYLTKYDQASLMDYCRNLHISDEDATPTPYDELGFEILYPFASRVLPIACGDACFLSSAGVILRTNGFARDAWTARGAFPWWGANSQRLTWREGSGGPIDFDSTLSAGSFEEGVHQIQYSGSTKYASDEINGEGQVVVGNEQWAAIAMVAL